MPADSLYKWLRVAVWVAIPTMACFGYYTLDGLGEARSAWAIPAVLAYPVAVIGAVGLVATLGAARPRRAVLWFWSLCVVAPVALLAWLWA